MAQRRVSGDPCAQQRCHCRQVKFFGHLQYESFIDDALRVASVGNPAQVLVLAVVGEDGEMLAELLVAFLATWAGAARVHHTADRDLKSPMVERFFSMKSAKFLWPCRASCFAFYKKENLSASAKNALDTSTSESLRKKSQRESLGYALAAAIKQAILTAVFSAPPSFVIGFVLGEPGHGNAGSRNIKWLRR
jgi:hypothetical protein